MDIVTTKLTVTFGGNSGWHSHPGGAIVIVQQGDITIYRSTRKGDDEHGQSESDQEKRGQFPYCVINIYTHGQSFTELPCEVDLVGYLSRLTADPAGGELLDRDAAR